MNLEYQIDLCSQNYQKWKSLALSANTQEEGKKCLERAFFWLELQTAFITLWSIEKAEGKRPEVKDKIFTAKANLTKKLAEYVDQTLKELDL
jgi:hypothetical protein